MEQCDKMNWVIYAVLAAILWGIGYTFLVPVSIKLHAYTISTVYGFFTFVTNLLIVVIIHDTKDFAEINNVKIIVYLAIYVSCLVAANIVFLLGYSTSNINPGVYILISSSYPVIALILSYFIFDKKNIDPYYGTFGIILTVTGCGLLAFA
jgi:drug/metabolite transporter (DMT)-like permease